MSDSPDKDTRGGALRSRGGAELLLAQDPAVLDALGLLGEDGEVREHVDGGDVGRKEEETLLALPERLDDLLDTALELARLTRALDGLEELLGELLVREGDGDRRDGVEGDLELLKGQLHNPFKNIAVM